MARQESKQRKNHGEATSFVPGSRTATNPAGRIVVTQTPDSVAESTPASRGQTSADAKLSRADLTRQARGR
jgi:hypothetical protein